jgi:hypothetical protein
MVLNIQGTMEEIQLSGPPGTSDLCTSELLTSDRYRQYKD